MDVIMVGIAVAHRDERRFFRVKLHSPEKIVRDPLPLLGAEFLTRGQGQAAVPDRTLDVGPLLPHRPKLARELLRIATVEVSRNALGATFFADVVEHPPKPPPSMNLRLHSGRPSSSLPPPRAVALGRPAVGLA